MLKIGTIWPFAPRKPEILGPWISGAVMSTDRTKYSPTRYSTGVGHRRRWRNGTLPVGKPDTEGASRKSTRKAWSLRLRSGSRRLQVHSGTNAGGHAGTSAEGTGGRETPLIRVTRLLTIKDLAEQLQIKPGTLYAWAAQGKIPSRKIHGLVRFVPLEIDRWVASFSLPKSTPLQLETPRPDHTDLEQLIARAKRAVYTSGHGETITPSPTGKE
jgi:excisionase family DNA binding protein